MQKRWVCDSEPTPPPRRGSAFKIFCSSKSHPSDRRGKEESDEEAPDNQVGVEGAEPHEEDAKVDDEKNGTRSVHGLVGFSVFLVLFF